MSSTAPRQWREPAGAERLVRSGTWLSVAGVLLCGLIVGVRAARVVGLVDDSGELRDLLLQRALDPLLQGHVDHAAPLTAAAELEVGDVVLDVQELDPAAVGCDRRVDHLVQDLLDPALDILVAQGFHGATPPAWIMVSLYGVFKRKEERVLTLYRAKL